jgi:methylmalonyl-CoA mutase, C-terminal domain
MEVIYTGLHQTPEQIVETVLQEDADAVGLSILSGAHMTLVPRIAELLKSEGAEDVVLVVGGTIPSEDIPELKQLGVAEVFTPGAPVQGIIDYIKESVLAWAAGRRARFSASSAAIRRAASRMLATSSGPICSAHSRSISLKMRRPLMTASIPRSVSLMIFARPSPGSGTRDT